MLEGQDESGTEFVFDLKKTLKESLEEGFKTIESLGVNPLDKWFYLIKTGSGLGTKYKAEPVPKEDEPMSNTIDPVPKSPSF